MPYPSRKTSLVVSVATLLSAAAVTAGIFAKRHLARKAASKKAGEDDAGGESIMEDLVSHNTQGF